MTLGRNDPCHCGSGRKYKKCHEAADREAERAPALKLVRGAAAVNRGGAPGARRVAADAGGRGPGRMQVPREALAGAWEVAVSPVPARFQDDPAARTVVVLLVVDGMVLACPMENRPLEEPDVLAGLLAREVVQAVADTGVRPPRVSIRQPSLEGPLRALLVPHGIAVACVERLPGLDVALHDLMTHVFGANVPLSQLRSQPETWAGWGLPGALVAQLFEAAAAFRRAAPWEVVPPDLPMLVSRPGEPEWAALVLGWMGEQLGLALYRDPEDCARMMAVAPGDPAAAFGSARERVLSLLYNVREELPKRMREEIRGAGWAVAGADAYPTLLVLGTPGGGVREGDAGFLRDVLAAVPRFVAATPAPFANWDAAHEGVTWQDVATGVVFRLEASAEGDLGDPITWHEALAACGPSGPGATPGAQLEEEEAGAVVADTVARFRAWLRDPVSGKALGEATANRHAAHAGLFVEYCARVGGKPVSAVTEYDLRDFLHCWYPLKVEDTERGARGVLVSLRRFFVFLRERAGVACPWAAPVLADTDYFLLRWADAPDGFRPSAGDEAWQVEGTQSLQALVLFPDPDPDPAGALAFGPQMGPVEFGHYRALHRLWQQWRDAVIASGVVAPGAVREALRARTAAWSVTPVAGGAEGETPVAAIARERAALRRQERVRGPGRRAPRRGRGRG